VPIEQVVDPNRQRLDVAIGGGDNVAANDGCSNRHREGLVVQTQEIVLDFGRPVGRKSPFDARSRQPATVAVD